MPRALSIIKHQVVIYIIFFSSLFLSIPSHDEIIKNQIIQTTMNRTRIYIFFGTSDALVDMMESMEAIQLFDKGEYLVIFVDMMSYSKEWVDAAFLSAHLINFYFLT